MNSLIFSYFFSPIPLTFINSSKELNDPYSNLYSIIRFAIDKPIPGKSCNCFSLALLIDIKLLSILVNTIISPSYKTSFNDSLDKSVSSYMLILFNKSDTLDPFSNVIISSFKIYPFTSISIKLFSTSLLSILKALKIVNIIKIIKNMIDKSCFLIKKISRSPYLLFTNKCYFP